MKSKIIVVVVLCLIIVALSVGCNATESNDGEDNSRVNTHGFLVTVYVMIKGGNGKVWATAKNEFTLFPATVKVVLGLYLIDNDIWNVISEKGFRVSAYEGATLVCEKSIDDLNLGQTLTVEAETGGKRYWIASMRYKIDNGEWKETYAGPASYNELGEYLAPFTNDV